jgi:hypothetical protein
MSKLNQPSAQQASSGDKKTQALYGSTVSVIGSVALMIAAIMTGCVTQPPIRATKTVESNFTALAKLATPTRKATNTLIPTDTLTPTVTITPTITQTKTPRPTGTPRPTRTTAPHPPVDPDLVFVKWAFMRLYNEMKKVYDGCELELAPYGELSRIVPLHRTFEEIETNPFICLVVEQGDELTDQTQCIKKLKLCSDEEGSEAPCDTILVVMELAGRTGAGILPPMTYLGDYLIFFSFTEPMVWCAPAFYSAIIPSSKVYFYADNILLTGHGINEYSCQSFSDLLTKTPYPEGEGE